MYNNQVPIKSLYIYFFKIKIVLFQRPGRAVKQIKHKHLCAKQTKI